MRGYIEKRGNSYRITIEVGRTAEGTRKKIRKTLKGVKKKEAEAELARMLHEINTGIYVEPSKLTFAEYLDRWLPSHTEANLSPKTSENYAREIKNRIKPVIGHILLEDLNPLIIQNFVDEVARAGRLGSDKKLSPETIKYNIRIIKASLNQAVEWGLISNNPVKKIQIPKATKTEMNILTEEQIKAMLAALKTGRDFQKYALILLLVSTGLRIGEALALTWDDVDFNNETLTVNKTIQKVKGNLLIKSPKTESSNRKIPIEPTIIAVLNRHRIKQKEKRLKLGNKWKGTGNHIFTGPAGNPIDHHTVKQWWMRFRRKHGLENIRIHDLRHTHATHLLASGKVDVKTIAERLGHKNATMTLNTYSHVLPAKQREAALALAHLWE